MCEANDIIDNITTADTTPAPPVIAQRCNGSAAVTALVPDDARIPVGMGEVAVPAKKRRMHRKKVTPAAGISASAQSDAAGSKIDAAATAQRPLVGRQKIAVPVEATSASEKDTQSDGLTKKKIATCRQVRCNTSPVTAQPTTAPALAAAPVPASELAPAAPAVTVPFPHIPRGKRDKFPAWYLQSASTPSSPSGDQPTQPVRSAAGTYRCDVCQKEWPCRAALLRHSYKHTKHLRYTCVCGKVFTRGDTVRVHCRKMGCEFVARGGVEV